MELLQKDINKIKKLDEFMTKLLDTNIVQSKVKIYEEYTEYIDLIKPIDLFYLNMYKQTSTLNEEEIITTADKFVNVFHQRLEKYEITDYKNDFFNYLYKESLAIETHLNSLKQYFKKSKIIENKDVLLKGFKQCLDIEKKFIKKENILFLHLEKSIPSTKPLEVMWALHDDARRTLKEIIKELSKENINQTDTIILIGRYYYTVYGIFQKEQLILYPVAVKLLTDVELKTMFEESLEYWYAFIEVKSSKPLPKDRQSEFIDGFYKTETGILNIKELDLVLKYIPLDITFVDKDDKVKYFNNRKERHFPRNPSIIGRLVKHCHPPKSVKIVEDIVNDFKAGRKDFEEFWITFNKSTLYITYYAVRDKQGIYMGVLEVSQDITHIKSLEGEKRLLDT